VCGLRASESSRDHWAACNRNSRFHPSNLVIPIVNLYLLDYQVRSKLQERDYRKNSWHVVELCECVNYGTVLISWSMTLPWDINVRDCVSSYDASIHQWQSILIAEVRWTDDWLLVIKLWCETKLCSVRKPLFTNAYKKYDVIITSSVAMNVYFYTVTTCCSSAAFAAIFVQRHTNISQWDTEANVSG